MRRARLALAASATVLLAAVPSLAQETQALAAAAPPPDSQGLTVYPAEFFASSSPGTAMDMVNRVPGFSFDGGDSGVRGYSGAAGNVLIDGRRPASKSESLEEQVRRIPASQVERIELIRGGAPGIDMQGQTVLVNVVRRADSRTQLLFAVASGFLQDGRTTPAMRFEGSHRFDVDRSGDFSLLIYRGMDDGAGEGSSDRIAPSGAVVRDSYADETGGGLGATLALGWRQPLAGGDLAINSRVNIDQYEFALEEAVFAPTPGAFFVHDDFDTVTAEAGFNWQRPLGPRTRLELVGLQRGRDVNFVTLFEDGTDEARFTADNRSGETIGSATVRFTRTPTWSLEAGGEVAYNFLDSAQTYAENGAPVALPAADTLVEELRSEASFTSTWRPSSRWTLETGLRVETSTISQSGDISLERSFVYPKPRAQLTWTPNEQNQLRLRVERDVGQLNFDDFVASATFSTGVITAGNQNLEPFKRTIYQAAWERRFWGDGALVVTLTHRAVTDAVDRAPIFTTAGVFDAPANIGEGRDDDIQVNLTLPTTRLGIPNGLLRASVEWNDTEVTDPTTGQTRPISGAPEVEAELHFTQDIQSLRLQWGVDMFLAQEWSVYRFDTVEHWRRGTWLQPFIEWKPRPDINFRVEFANLLGRDFGRDREVYAGPRNVSPLLYREARHLNFDPFIYARLRRNF